VPPAPTRLARPHDDRPLAGRGTAHLRGAQRGPIRWASPSALAGVLLLLGGAAVPLAGGPPARVSRRFDRPARRARRAPPRPRPSGSAEAAALYERASQAYAAEEWEQAAEYARHAVSARAGRGLAEDGAAVRAGEALLRAGHAREAVEAFTAVVEDGGAHLAQALHSGSRPARRQATWRAPRRGVAGSGRSFRGPRGHEPSRDGGGRHTARLVPGEAPSISRTIASAAAAGSAAWVIGRPTTR